jgi:catechol 2,3-dioxygenase-like lactoylglutathione lyase family enzyme
MALEPVGYDSYRCRAPGRQVAFSGGPANQLKFAHFAFHTGAAWDAFRTRVWNPAQPPLPPGFEAGAAITFCDPDGNQIVFTAPAEPALPAPVHVRPAALQHFALRTAQLDAMLDFYTGQLGFVLSDAVRDAEGALRACFLRSDSLHHSLALFFAPAACFDHQSFEASGWDSMKAWGDHMAGLRVPIVWGIGRHGPGNDVFFMVRDPDGNLAEISAEIEHCAPGRPAGLWPHEERTLNLWGKAILRS